MNKFHLLTSVAICGILFFSSCEKDNDPAPATGKEVTINASDYSQWVYFSFSEGKTVGSSKITDGQLTDPTWAARNDWDIAFHRHDVRTNSGASGNGKGGIQEIIQTEFDFDAVTEAPASGYLADETITVTYDISQMTPGNIGECENGVSTVAAGWAKRTGMPPVWNIYKKVFVVKTGDGKYAKIYLKNFLNDMDATGYVTMEYVYQPDGSRYLDTAL